MHSNRRKQKSKTLYSKSLYFRKIVTKGRQPWRAPAQYSQAKNKDPEKDEKIKENLNKLKRKVSKKAK